MLPTIRSTNPTRNVLFGGLSFMNPTWINSHPDDLLFPPDDPHLLLEVHSYSPFNFCGKPTKISWDSSVIDSWVAGLDAWATQRNRSVLVGEFGCKTAQTNTSGRYEWYSYMVGKCRAKGWASARHQLQPKLTPMATCPVFDRGVPCTLPP